DEENGTALARIPDEVPADRPSKLELVADDKLLGEIRRDFAVVEPLDGERELAVLRRRGDRVAALGLVAVLRGEADVHVLAGEVAGPVGRGQHDRLHGRRLLDELRDVAELPGERSARGEASSAGRGGGGHARTQGAHV